MGSETQLIQQFIDATNAELLNHERRLQKLEAIVSTPVLAPLPTPSPSTAKLLFASGFEGSVSLPPPTDFFGTGAWQDIVGSDGLNGFAWPPNIWGGSPTRFQMLVGTVVDQMTLPSYMGNAVVPIVGHRGVPTKALDSWINPAAVWTGSAPQNPLQMQPKSEAGDLYISYWLMFQPDLLAKMTPQNWRTFFEWKTAGDYRVIVEVVSWDNGCGGVKPNGPMLWQVRGDNEANGGLPYQEFWKVQDCSIPVPAGQWFKFEVFWHRSSGPDARVWAAVNGHVICDHAGPNRGVNNAPINRIMLSQLYSPVPYPIYQWIDDIEIWDGFPPATGNNPPYGSH
jgi:hypothetical protein